jgi:hypothetical protein
MKICGKCKISYTLDMFDKQGDRQRSWCKHCVKSYNQSYHHKSEKHRLKSEGKKRCTVCKKVKSLQDYYRNGFHPKSGALRLDPKCKQCKRELTQATRRDRQYRKLYGITLAEYDTLLASQEHRCAICYTHEDDLPQKLCIDHDHDSGVVRGLLCDTCNRGLGLLKDKSHSLERAVQYLNGIQ